MLRLNNILLAVEALSQKRFPSLTAYRNVVHKGFKRPSFLTEVGKSTMEDATRWTVDRTAQVKLTFFETVNDYHDSQIETLSDRLTVAMELFSCAAIQVSDRYLDKAAMAEGSDEGYAEAGRMLMEAKVRGMNEYNASEGAQLMLEYEMSLAETIRDDASTNSAYWDAGYRKGQEYSKGLAAGMSMGADADSGDFTDPNSANYSPIAMAYAGMDIPGYATGLQRVPYNNYPALLHEGERVLTAAEARGYEQGGGSVQIVMNGTVIREDADIDRVAQALLDKLRQAKTAGVYR